MNIRNTLRDLVQYYTVTRQAGHTTLMLRGVLSSDKCAIVTSDLGMFNYIKKNWSLAKGAHPVTLNNLEVAIRGMNLPIAFDNCALQNIFEKSLVEIQKLEQENKKLKQENSTIKQKLAQVKNILKP